MEINIEAYIGKELYGIKDNKTYCPNCNHTINTEWKVEEEPYMIIKFVEVAEYELFETRRALIPITNIDKYFFTTPEAAQSECDRRNNEEKGVARE